MTVQFGYKLMSETFGPDELVRQAVRAEEVGFDFVELSDHYHPWLDEQGHSPFAWSVLGAIAAKTERIGLATGVTCPTIRYHPAIVAQAAATVALLSGGRFTLGVGSGEKLNEHVVGEGFPNVRGRQERLREALEIIRLLWSGGYHSYEGKHLRLEDARVFDLPPTPPAIAVAAGGSAAARLAGELGDGLFATEPKKSLVEQFHAAGGRGPCYAEVPMAWAHDEAEAIAEVLKKSRWSLAGWKVLSELPNPANFDQASEWVDEDDVRAKFPLGPDPDVHAEAVQPYLDVGFDHVVLQNAGPDADGFLDFYAEKLADRLRALPAASARGPSRTRSSGR
jgi:G6PDH family F420-dependent oxidoreductase